MCDPICNHNLQYDKNYDSNFCAGDDNHHHFKVCDFGVSGIPFINMDTIFKTRFQDKFILKNK